MNPPHRVTGVHTGKVLRGSTIAQPYEVVAPFGGHVRRSHSGVGRSVVSSPHDTREPGQESEGVGGRIGCGDVVVAHGGSIDAGMLI